MEFYPDFKGCITINTVIFLTHKTVLLVLILAFAHLVILSTVLIIIDQKMELC